MVSFKATRHALYTKVLPVIDLAQMYICDTNKLVAEFSGLARGSANVVSEKRNHQNPSKELKLVQDAEYRRLATTVDMKLALQLYNVYRFVSTLGIWANSKIGCLGLIVSMKTQGSEDA